VISKWGVIASVTCMFLTATGHKDVGMGFLRPLPSY